jgi:predicted nucleic acid-binding protein
MLVLLDSTVLIDTLRGRPAGDRVVALERAGDVPCTTGINVEEIVRGILPHEAEAVRRLFAGLEVLAIGRTEGWQAGEWRSDFASRGMSLSQSDALIAAVAYTSGAVLATGNPRDFPMQEITVEHWPVGA